ncbi:MAG: hypothetical protein ACXVBW_13585, partial [Bdellovibrionota bacterium]
MKAVFSIAVALIPVLSAGPFGSCVAKTKPASALESPGWIARHADQFWESTALKLHARIDEERASLKGRLMALV